MTFLSAIEKLPIEEVVDLTATAYGYTQEFSLRPLTASDLGWFSRQVERWQDPSTTYLFSNFMFDCVVRFARTRDGQALITPIDKEKVRAELERRPKLIVAMYKALEPHISALSDLETALDEAGNGLEQTED